ncbi:MAG: ABC transporter ATP-binding protein [Oscillibacter sp.]
MELYRVESLTFTYPGQFAPALRDVSLTLRAGEFVTLCGLSGSGKSTLLRQLKTALAPNGVRSGAVLFAGRLLSDVSPREQAERIGFVQQSPENQIVTDKVWHELAFGLESLGYDTPTIRRRVAEMAGFFGMESWFHRETASLSGGQKQLLNLAAVLTLQPDVLILDEPTAQLDPIAAADFLAALARVNRELGTTMLLSEQRLEEALPLSDRAVVLDGGAVLADGAPRAVGAQLRTAGHELFRAMPAAMRVWAAVENDLPCPVSVREGRDWLADFAASHPLKSLPERPLPAPSEETVVTVSDAWFRYTPDAPDVLRGLELTVRRGELFAILGGNGAANPPRSGAGGPQKPYRGEVRVTGKTALLPQEVQTLFAKKTVREDLAEVTSDGAMLAYVTALCRLDALLDRHPYDLSGGEQQRAALAKVLLTRPDILLLDEPTRGLDAAFKAELAELLHDLLAQGVTVILVSHDVEFCAAYAQRCALFFDGSIASDGAPREFFALNRFYTTAANRMARGRLPEAVTAEDIIAACGGREAPPKERREPPPQPPKAADIPAAPPEKRRLSPRTAASALVALLLIPLTLVFGPKLLGDRSYYAVSLLMVLEAMLPFFLTFEGRKPRARELVVTAVLCALGVAGRAAFFMLPQCKPVLALTILAGAALGGETGFLVGAATMLVSNILFRRGRGRRGRCWAWGCAAFSRAGVPQGQSAEKSGDALRLRRSERVCRLRYPAQRLLRAARHRRADVAESCGLLRLRLCNGCGAGHLHGDFPLVFHRADAR